jgi:hypothetical protein
MGGKASVKYNKLIEEQYYEFASLGRELGEY